MTEKHKMPLGKDTQSLSRQISLAASRLDQRKRTAQALGSSLKSRIHSAFTSPGGLAIAGTAGFMAAEWMHRPVKTPAKRPASKQPSKSSRRSQTAVMPKLVLLLKFVLDLKTHWEKANSGVRQRTDDHRPQEHAGHEPGTTQDAG